MWRHSLGGGTCRERGSFFHQIRNACHDLGQPVGSKWAPMLECFDEDDSDALECLPPLDFSSYFGASNCPVSFLNAVLHKVERTIKCCLFVVHFPIKLGNTV